MKKVTISVLTILLVAVILAVPAFAADTLIPVGQTVGLALDTRGLTVTELDEQLGQNARTAGLRPGDTIIKADGQGIETAEQLQALVERCRKAVVLTVVRGDEEVNLTVEPVNAEGRQRLGIFVRQGITGIGTVTYYDPNSGAFGVLGHGVSGAGGDLLALKEGQALDAEVTTIRKGKVGTPGQLQGEFRTETVLGNLDRNTSCGVFGTTGTGWTGIPLPVAENEDVHTGEAMILSDLAGGAVEQYAIEITKVYPQQNTPGRNLLLRVTDEALLEQTGGIVQGMSGSPIIQDGKLVGAVTHVLVNDPTTGYGIFIENMLDAAA